MHQTDQSILHTKQHFHLLDGMRGIAAIAIVIFHFMEVAITDYSKNFIGHGFLAVDFFFCLSGFVIGYAYDDRIKKMGAWEFFKSRLIRLHPLVILGSVLGLLTFLFDPFATFQSTYSIGKITLLFITSILLIPLPVMDERYLNLFGLNAPAWSLFWEYAANIFYAFILYKISRQWLIVLTLIAATVLAFAGYHANSLMGGWGGPSFWDGGARIFFSFLAGLLIYRSGWIIKSRIGFIALSVLLAFAFVMPWSKWVWLTELLVVLFYFPLLISLGAGGTLRPAMKKICIFAGRISYPLYMTHYAVIWMFANYYNSHSTTTKQLALIVTTGVIALIAVAYFFMVVYDEPLRRYLAEKRKSLHAALKK